MHTLPLSFSLLTYSGYWRPVYWPLRSFKCWLYNGYSVFMILLLHTFALCGVVDSLTSTDMKTMIDKFSLFISVLGVCCKVGNLFLRRDRIVGVTDILLGEKCLPRDEEERMIQREFDHHARTLPLSDWVPYALTSRTVFVLTLLHQTVGLMVCANASVAHETLISGLMIQICAQLEILCHRARTLPISLMEVRKYSESAEDLKRGERRIVGDLVQHHLDVYEFALTINTVFNFMIFVQFAVSSTVLCLSVYKMSTTDPFTVEFAWSFSYVCCMLTQVYLYCWYGNEVTLKSKQIGDAVYGMDWTVLPVSIMKSLLIIMARSTRPIKMCSGQIITLSSQSLMSIMKVSYSSYNLLKDSSR